MKTPSWELNVLSMCCHYTGGFRKTQVRVPGKRTWEHNHTQLNQEAFGPHFNSPPHSHPGQTLSPCSHPLMRQALSGPTRVQTLQTLMQSVWNH